MELKIKLKDNVAIFSIAAGIFGSQYSDQINQKLSSSLSQGQRTFIFDMTKVRAINSIGVGILMESWTRIKNAEGDLALTGLNSKVSDILAICETDQIIPISKNISEALDRLKKIT